MDELGNRTLGSELAQLRTLRDESLRTVAGAAGLSGTYLLKLERDEVHTPSPHVLRRLAEHYSVSYLALMRVAGYDVTDGKSEPVVAGVLAEALASEPLTDDEERAVTAFLSTLRSQRRS